MAACFTLTCSHLHTPFQLEGFIIRFRILFLKGGVVKGTGIIQVISTDFTVPLLHPDSAFADQPFIGIQLTDQHP